MSSAASLLLALVALSAAGASQADGGARFEPRPAEAAVGQPIEYVLALEHGADAELSLGEGDPFAAPAGTSAPALEPEGPPRVERRPLERAADGTRRVRTSFVWSVRALEGGRHAPASATLLVREKGAERALRVEPGAVSIAGSLGEGEDAPQPPTAHPPAPRWPSAGRGILVGALLVVLGALAALAWALRRRRRRAGATPAPSAEERLAALEPRVREGGETGALARELVLLVRGELDRALGVARSAASDEEWLAALGEAPLAPDEREAARALLVSLEAARYGGARPTRFALEEALAKARRLVEGARRVERERLAAEAGPARAARGASAGRAA